MTGWSGTDEAALLEQARGALANGAFTRAEASADLLLRRDPHSAPALVVLAFARLGMRQAGPARDAAERAVWMDTNDVQAHVALALALLLDGRADQAEAAARRAITTDPHSADAHTALAAVLKARGEKVEARSEMDRAVALEPPQADGQRIWRDWRAPIVGAVGLAGFLAYHALSVLGQRFSDRIVAVVLLVVIGGFGLAVLIGLHLQRRRLARMSPGARLVIDLEARRRRSEGWSDLGGPILIITGVVAALTVATLLYAAGQKATVELNVGDCFSWEPGTVISQVATIPCQVPHDIEIYAVLADPSPIGAPYPGFDALIAGLQPRCEAFYAGYVGVPYGRSAPAQIQTFAPLEVYWVANVRSLFCGLRSPSGRQLTGSLRDPASSRPTP